MKPQTIGRVLGIGVRVAGRMAGQRLNAPAARAGDAPASRAAPRPVTIDGARIAAGARTAGAATAGIGRGVGGFLKPFRRVGNIVFLEVVGAFFLLFVILFGNWAWKLRAEWPHGPEHTKLLVYIGLTLIFLYLGVSSFWRARRK